MDFNSVLASIESELTRLLHIRSVLTGGAPAKKRGRKSRSAKAAPPARAAGKKAARKQKAKAPSRTAPKKTRTLSPEGRKRIQEAVKRRWANNKKNS